MRMIKNPRLFIVFSGVAVLLVGLIIINKNFHQQYLTSYEDAGGDVYSCSRPIKAKVAPTNPLNGPPQGLIPYNQADAIKYCQITSIF